MQWPTHWCNGPLCVGGLLHWAIAPLWHCGWATTAQCFVQGPIPSIHNHILLKPETRLNHAPCQAVKHMCSLTRSDTAARTQGDAHKPGTEAAWHVIFTMKCGKEPRALPAHLAITSQKLTRKSTDDDVLCVVVPMGPSAVIFIFDPLLE